MLENVAYYKYTKCTLYYVSVLLNLGCWRFLGNELF